MGRFGKVILIALGALVVLLVVAAVSVPLFLNADSFRTRIESSVSKSLGRKVTIGKLTLSVWSGGLLAENATVADDPSFSSQPFLQAGSVKIRVEVLPLLLQREVHIRGFDLQSPKIQLLRSPSGLWNYSSIGASNKASAGSEEEGKRTFPDLTVARVEVANGQITVGAQPATSTAVPTPDRVYEQVDLDVKNFGFTSTFPFTASAHLPGEGTFSINGTAGPINEQDASATPFSGHLEMKHIDPLAAGFVDTSSGLSGLVGSLTLDAAWNGQQMHVTSLLVDTPHLNLVRTNTPRQPRSPGANPEGTTMLENLSVDDAEVKNGTLTLSTAGHAGAPAVYQQLNARLTNLTPGSASPFTLSAQLPGGGSLNASGKAGPFNQANNAATPLDAQVSLKHVQLETSGVLAPDAGISGLADLQAKIQSNGQTLNAIGTAHIDGIKLAKNGQPSSRPVDAQFSVLQNEPAATGQIEHATVAVGRAAVSVAGTYQSSGPTTAINLKVDGNAVPIDEIEAFLPALGVHLPQGSRLQGGTVTTALTISGSTANPVISGPVRLDNTQLAGFDLGSKLQGLARLTGGRIGSATGSGTTIRSLSMDVREAGGGIRTDRIALDLTGLGTATGAGSVSAGGALDYNMILKLTGLTGGLLGGGAAPSNAGSASALAGLAGGLADLISGGGGGGGSLAAIGGIAGNVLRNGVPVAIGGTTANPTFSPNLGGLATGIGGGAAGNLLQGKTGQRSPSNKPAGDPLQNAIGDLFGKKHR